MLNISKRGANLTREDRMRGGQNSARKQHRDASGKFAGARDSEKKTHRMSATPPPEPAEKLNQDQAQLREEVGEHRSGRHASSVTPN